MYLTHIWFKLIISDNICAWICIKQLEKIRVAYHKSCQREQTAIDKEKQANDNSEMSPEKKQKITEAREKATEEKEKVRRDVNTLHHFILMHAE